MVKSYEVASKYLHQLTAAITPPAEEVSAEDPAKQTRAVEKLLKDTILQKLPEYTNKVYAVGGFVRDSIMGRNPKDIDLVVDDSEKKMEGAKDFAHRLVNALGISSGRNPHVLNSDYGIWGVSLLNPKENGERKPFVYDGTDISGYVIELTPPRKEGPYNPAERKPQYVEYTSIDDDAKRRDLTINAVYKNVATGKIKDPVGGQKDIEQKNLRPPEHPEGILKIYEEDPLRILRLVRFKGKTGFNVDHRTVETIKHFMESPQGKSLVLEKISKERIADELEKILVGPDPAESMEFIKKLGVLDLISKDLSALVDIYHDTVYHHGESVWDHTMEVLRRTPPTLKARLGALFHDIGKIETQSTEGERSHFIGHEEASARMVDRILRDLKFPTSIVKSVRDITHAHMGFKGFKFHQQKASKQLKKLRILIEKLYDNLDDALAVMKADAKDEEEAKDVDELKERITQLKNDDLEKGLLVEKGGRYTYTSPLKGEHAKNLREEFKEITDDKTLGAVLNKLKQMSMAGQFEGLNDEKERIDKAKKIVKGLVSNKKQLEDIVKNYEEELKSEKFFTVKRASMVVKSFLQKENLTF